MPAFTFEKISPPVHCESITPTLKKPRGVISLMIGRLMRVKPGQCEECSAAPSAEKSA